MSSSAVPMLPAVPMTVAVAQANAVVGLPARGTLFDQVNTLMTELGLQQQPSPPQQQPSPPRAATSMAVQASTGPNYFELLQQQKPKGKQTFLDRF